MLKLEVEYFWQLEDVKRYYFLLGPIRKLNPVFDYSCTQNRIVDE